jgi:hypothetical protein
VTPAVAVDSSVNNTWPGNGQIWCRAEDLMCRSGPFRLVALPAPRDSDYEPASQSEVALRKNFPCVYRTWCLDLIQRSVYRQKINAPHRNRSERCTSPLRLHTRVRGALAAPHRLMQRAFRVAQCLAYAGQSTVVLNGEPDIRPRFTHRPNAHTRRRAFRSTRLFAGLQRRHLPAAVVVAGAESPPAAAHSRPAAGHRC